MGFKINKTTRTNGNRKIVGAIRKYLTEPVTFLGVKYTPGQLAKEFEKGIVVGDATDSAKLAWHEAVAKERDNMQELSGLQAALRGHVGALFGEASTPFADFGFKSKKAAKMSAETKAQAVAKRALSRQRKSVVVDTSSTAAAPKMETPAANEAPKSPAASVPASNATTPSPSNGAAAVPAVLS